MVLLSGGQDSATSLFWALRKFDEVRAIGFWYGQKHSKENDYAQNLCHTLGVPYELKNVAGLVGDSALTIHQADINAEHPMDPGLPASFTPGRNMIFLLAAAIHGAQLGITNLVTGVCQTDFSGYPDCRRVFIDSMETTLTLAMAPTQGSRDFQIHTPLMYLTKAQTWKLAVELSDETWDVVNIIREKTLTDYNGNETLHEWGRGELDNPASKLRAAGYYEAKEKGWL